MVKTDGKEVKMAVPGRKRRGLFEPDPGNFASFTKRTLGLLANHPSASLVLYTYLLIAGEKQELLLSQAETAKATGLCGGSVLNSQASLEACGLIEKLPTGKTGKGAIHFRIKIADSARPADGEQWAKGSPDLLAALVAIPERQRGSAALVALATVLCGGIPGDRYGGARVSIETIADILQPIGTDGKPSRRRWSASRIEQARKALKDAGIAHRTETEGVHRWTINPPKIGRATVDDNRNETKVPTATKPRYQPERNQGTNRNETKDVLDSSSSSYEEDEEDLKEDLKQESLASGCLVQGPGRSLNDQGFVNRAVEVLISARDPRIYRIATDLLNRSDRADVRQVSGVRLLAAAYRFIRSETRTEYVQGFLKYARQIGEVEAREIVSRTEMRPMGGEPDPQGRPVPEPLKGYNPLNERERTRFSTSYAPEEFFTEEFANRIRQSGLWERYESEFESNTKS